MIKKQSDDTINQILYLCAIALTSIAIGLSVSIISNFFKDAYNVTAYQRGFLEFPRELPGLLCVFIISALSFLNDIRLSSIALFASAICITILGLFTPSFIGMSVLVFFHSVGIHINFPLADAIGMSLVKDKSKIGKKLGLYGSVKTAFSVIAGLIVFFGFKYGSFSFKQDPKVVFLISGIASAMASLFLLVLDIRIHGNKPKPKKSKFKLDSDYKYYYILAVVYGVQKQIAIVFGPWVLIDLLSKGPDTISALQIVSSFICIAFIPFIGKMIDRHGVKKMLYYDAVSFIIIYLLYGIMSRLIFTHAIATVGIPLFFIFGLYILDIMSDRMNIIRISYMKKIAKSSEDITTALSTGLSMDHVVSIICAYVGGIVWTHFGPQYVFYAASFLSLVNLFVATRVQIEN